MKYYVEVNGRPHEVTVVERLGELELTVDGKPFELDYEEVDALGQVALRVGTRTFGVSIEGGADSVSATIAGHLYAVTIEDERERAAHAAERASAAAGGIVKSVMPGVVVDLLVEAGDKVTKGQPLLILEAMKMQNEISSTSDGTVVKVHITKGDAVSGGAKLITLE